MMSGDQSPRADSPPREGATGDEADVPIAVLYIGGDGRSGSTLLSTILGNHDGYLPVGELPDVWHALETNERCGCGEPFSQCRFWRAVGDVAFGGWDHVDRVAVIAEHARFSRHRRVPELLLWSSRWRTNADFDAYCERLAVLYSAIQQVSGCTVIVDSTKSPAFAVLLRNVPRIDLRLVHLVRDSRGVAFSWSKQEIQNPQYANNPTLRDTPMATVSPWKSALTWDLKNALFACLAPGKQRLRVDYEAVAADPTNALGRIRSFAERDKSPATGAGSRATFTSMPFHTLGGNPVRFKRGASRGTRRCHLAHGNAQTAADARHRVDISVARYVRISRYLAPRTLAQSSPSAADAIAGVVVTLVTPRVALLTNAPAPYRTAFFNELARYCRLLVVFDTKLEPDREWSIDEDDFDFDWTVTRAISIRRRTMTGRLSDRRVLQVPLNTFAVLERFRPDVVVSSELGARTMWAELFCRIRRRPLIVWSEGVPHSDGTSSLRRFRRVALLRGARRVWCNGVESARSIANYGVKSDRVDLRIVGIETARWESAVENELATTRALVRSGYGLRGAVLLFVGRLTPLKGVPELLGALSALSARPDVPLWSVIFVGEGPSRDIIQVWADAHPEVPVVLTGFVQPADLAQHYAAADIFVMPSLQDVWGFVCLEALVSGLPQLTSFLVGGAPDLITSERIGEIIDPSARRTTSHAVS